MAPKHKMISLWVKALAEANVREIDQQGKPLMALRVVGKQNGQVLPEGVQVPYHPHYIAEIKRQSLMPMDLQTAKLAGVHFTETSKEL
jgi:hypothetical protein